MNPNISYIIAEKTSELIIQDRIKEELDQYFIIVFSEAPTEEATHWTVKSKSIEKVFEYLEEYCGNKYPDYDNISNTMRVYDSYVLFDIDIDGSYWNVFKRFKILKLTGGKSKIL